MEVEESKRKGNEKDMLSSLVENYPTPIILGERTGSHHLIWECTQDFAFLCLEETNLVLLTSIHCLLFYCYQLILVLVITLTPLRMCLYTSLFL